MNTPRYEYTYQSDEPCGEIMDMLTRVRTTILEITRMDENIIREGGARITWKFRDEAWELIGIKIRIPQEFKTTWQWQFCRKQQTVNGYDNKIIAGGYTENVILDINRRIELMTPPKEDHALKDPNYGTW